MTSSSSLCLLFLQQRKKQWKINKANKSLQGDGLFETSWLGICNKLKRDKPMASFKTSVKIALIIDSTIYRSDKFYLSLRYNYEKSNFL